MLVDSFVVLVGPLSDCILLLVVVALKSSGTAEMMIFLLSVISFCFVYTCLSCLLGSLLSHKNVPHL